MAYKYKITYQVTKYYTQMVEAESAADAIGNMPYINPERRMDCEEIPEDTSVKVFQIEEEND